MIRSRNIRAAITIVLGLLVLMLAAQAIAHGFESLSESLNYRKDFLQEFLMAKATLAGADPYQPVNQLITQFLQLPPDAKNVFPHASPHPPTLIPFILPLASMQYAIAALFWLLLSITALAASSLILCKLYLRGAAPKTLAIFVLLLSSCCMYYDLILGQLNTFVLLAVSGCIAAHSAGRKSAAGFCLGVALCLKFFGLPLLVFFAIRREFRIAAIACTVVALSLGSVWLLIGSAPLTVYFETIIPLVTHAYRPDEFNVSLQTFGQRVFAGLYPSVQKTATVPPILNYPRLADPAGVVVTAIVSGLAFLCALREKRAERSLAYLTALTAVISPIAWSHGFLLFAPLLILGIAQRAELFRSPPARVFAIVFALGLWNAARLRNPIVGDQTVLSVWYHPLLAAPLISAVGLLVVFGWRFVVANSKHQEAAE